MTYDEANARWSKAWVLLWLVNVVVLAALAPFMVPRRWAAAFALLFLLPEMIGLLRHHDALPPLTYVVRRYVPRWVPTAVTFGCGAWLAEMWVDRADHPLLALVIIATFVGWLTNHWDVTYSE